MSLRPPSRQAVEEAKLVKALTEHPGWKILFREVKELEKKPEADLHDPKVDHEDTQLARGFLSYPGQFQAVVANFLRIADTSPEEPGDEDEGNYR